MTMTSKQNEYLGIATIVCALIALIAVFCTWVTVNPLIGSTVKYSGLDLVKNDDWNGFSDSQKYAGEVTLILGILAIIFEAAALAKPKSAGVACAAITAFLMLVAFIYACCFGSWNVFGDSVTFNMLIGAKVKVAYGAYLADIFTFLALIVSAVQAYGYHAVGAAKSS